MKQLPGGLEASLASGVTTLCWCWRLTRRDGTKLGFTDHDRNVSFEGTVFEAAAGFTASETKVSVGLNVDNLEVTGALSSERLNDEDLAAGLFDDAYVEIFRVDWQVPDNRVLMRTGSLGEVKRAGNSFAAEVRGLAHYLQQPKGRVFQYNCDADLGDGRCRVDLDQVSYTAGGTMAAANSSRVFQVSGLEAFENDWFSRGLLTFSGGLPDGQKIEVKAHTFANNVVTIELWEDARGPLEVGQAFEVKAGCDKTIGMCEAKFANAANYRGFPHMPGNDFVAKVARSSRR